jgi:hypothetical protein
MVIWGTPSQLCNHVGSPLCDVMTSHTGTRHPADAKVIDPRQL